MPHSPKLGNPPPIGTPLDAPEWLAWKREIADWYYAIIAAICSMCGNAQEKAVTLCRC